MSEQVFYDGGIYQRVKMPVSMATLRLVADAHNLDVVLEAVELAALEILSEYEVPPYALPNDAPAEARDAHSVMLMLRNARSALAGQDAREAALWAFKLGAVTERMGIRWAEPHAKRGRRVLAAAQQGAAALHGPRTLREAQWAEYQKAVDELCARYTFEHACRLAAKRFHVTVKTVKRRTANRKIIKK